jgi:hypothetical protein
MFSIIATPAQKQNGLHSKGDFAENGARTPFLNESKQLTPGITLDTCEEAEYKAPISRVFIQHAAERVLP